MGKDIFVDTKKIDWFTLELKGFEKEVGIATYHALKRTVDRVVTHVGRIVPKEYAIKAKEVKESFKGGIKYPSYSDLSASIESTGHTLSLAHFPHTPLRPPKSKRRYKVKVQIIKSKGKQELGTNPKPFVATTGALSKDKIQYNVFKRDGDKRLPISVIRTLSIPQMITNLKIEEEIKEFALEVFNERLQHEIERAMTNIGG